MSEKNAHLFRHAHIHTHMMMINVIIIRIMMIAMYVGSIGYKH